jgi:hypothetical protein
LSVALRLLVVATDADDIELPGWTSILDRIGTPYDVLHARDGGLTTSRLVRPDGVGRYSGVLLTSAGLLVRAAGGYVSALDERGWAALWAYERAFAVRQVALNTGPAGTPEDYCLRPAGEGPTGSTPLPFTLTPAGADLFDDLRPQATFPLSDAYVYRTRVAAGCRATPVLTSGQDVLGVLSTSGDGRERLALTFTVGALQPVEELLGYGLVRWATRGVLLGEQRHWLEVDVDDWFNANSHGAAGEPLREFRLSAADAIATATGQNALRSRFPLAGEFALNMAYNGGRMDPTAPAGCDPAGSPDPLTSVTRCLVGRFRWVNHTLTHPQMNSTSYAESRAEIEDNLRAAATLGLPVDPAVLKTPEYSGLGVQESTADGDPDRSVATLQDNGLGASNRALLDAAADLGVRYVHGNMSFPSHRPGCFNCGIRHPLRPDLLVVPDWPTDVIWEATTPREQTTRYNAERSAEAGDEQVRAPVLTYEQFVAAESEQGLRHLMRGSAYTHTFHQTNLHQYAPGASLLGDWLEAVLEKYSDYYAVPLLSPGWSGLAAYVEDRTQHFAALDAGADAVWDRTTDAVTYTPAADSALFVTGLATRPATTPAESGGSEAAQVYGTDTVSRVSTKGGSTVTLLARPRT